MWIKALSDEAQDDCYAREMIEVVSRADKL